jgi:hypothetical protein
MRFGNQTRVRSQEQPAGEKQDQEGHTRESNNQIEVRPFRVFAVVRRRSMEFSSGFKVFVAHVRKMRGVSKRASKPTA